MLQGLRNTYKGEFVGQEMTRWPDQLDFSAELSKARSAKPDALYVFYPGGAGIQFITQYVQSGLKGQIPLYQDYTIDELSLPRLKDLAVGILGRSNGLTTCPTRPTRSSSPVTSPSTKNGHRITPPRPTTPSIVAQQRGHGGQRRPLEKGRDAQRNGEGRFQIGARQLQIRQQPHPDPELLSHRIR